MRNDISKILLKLNEASDMLGDICKSIYNNEADRDEIITNIAQEMPLAFSVNATSIFKLKENINSLITDMTDEAIRNEYLEISEQKDEYDI